jgi:hypothetical protein
VKGSLILKTVSGDIASCSSAELGKSIRILVHETDSHFLCDLCCSTLDSLISPPITLPQEKPLNWEVYFSPQGGCTDAVIRELNKAKSTVLVQARSAKTHLPIHKLGDLFKKNFQINIWKTFNLEKGGT